MSEQIQPTEQDKAPQIKAVLKEGDITMKISKAPKQKKQTTDKKDIPYLDDHIQTYGNNLMSSIANLIEQSKQEKPKRAKKQMTPEMLERCRANLAKGRETIRKKKEAQCQPKAIPPTPEPVQPVIQKPIQQPVIQQPVIEQRKPIIQQPIPIPPPEKIKWKYGQKLF